MVSFTSASLAVGVALSVLSPALAQNTVRINALGDSITGSPGCWRGLLWQKLQAAGIKNTDFVGTKEPDSCGFYYDGQHDGRGGISATVIANQNQLPPWLSVSKPDIVQIELGTNDVWSNLPASTIVAALDKIVNQIRAQKSTMRILVAQITPMKPSGCSTCPQGVVAFNAAIAAWAPGKSTSSSPITVVDCFSGYNTATDTADGVHPNDNGNKKLANCWFEPLKAAIKAASGQGPATTMKTTARVTTAATTRAGTTAAVTTTKSGGGGGAPLYGQCGGQGYTGPTTCAVGSCKWSNQWYSQCLN